VEVYFEISIANICLGEIKKTGESGDTFYGKEE
jgi:hypothetical protein